MHSICTAGGCSRNLQGICWAAAMLAVCDALLRWCARPVAADAPNTLHVRSDDGADTEISPDVYSMFIETEISFGGEGGLYAEMVPNRDFETLGRGKIPTAAPAGTTTATLPRRGAPQGDALQDGDLDPHEASPNALDFRPWAGAGAVLSMKSESPVFSTNPHYLAVNFAPGGTVSNHGYWGMHFRTGLAYNATLYGRSPGAAAVTVEVQLLCGGAVVGSSPGFTLGPTWQRFAADIAVSAGCFGGELRLVSAGGGTAEFDHVSLFPGDAVAGLFRKDLFDYMKDFAPPLLRIPGGGYLVGSGQRTRFNWKKTLGPREERSGHFNSIWYYWVTDGFGLHEMLVLLAELQAAPLFGIYSGWSLWNYYPPVSQAGAFAQEALDFMEYCNGNASTVWGQKRVAAGLPAPANVTQVEMGNEEIMTGPDGYQGFYQVITDALWERYPDLQVVASSTGEVSVQSNRTASCMPCVGGCGVQPLRCAAWDEHKYGDPDVIAGLASTYDNYSDPAFCQTTTGGACPPVGVNEYGAWGGGMRAAAADAFFTIGLERNARVVKSSMYAPLFCNVQASSWPQNLINFNVSHSYAAPTYYSQKMLKDNLGTVLVPSDREGAQPLVWNGVASRRGSEVLVKLVNYANTATSMRVVLEGFGALTVNATADVLVGSDPSGVAGNTLDAPHLVMPSTAQLQPTGSNVTFDMPPYSVYILRAELH